MKKPSQFKTLRAYDKYAIMMLKKKKKKRKKKTVIKMSVKKNNKYHKYLLSDEWANLKIDLFKKRGKICERCLSNDKIHVHHLTYKNIFNEDPKDLLILCSKCHKKEHKI